MKNPLLVRLGGATLLSLTVAFAAPAFADEALDTIFDETQLQSVETGERLTYAHTRKVNGAPNIEDLEAGEMVLTVNASENGKRRTVVQLGDGTRQRTLEEFPGEGGNPLLMVFLETILGTVSKSTGGSPFYIRNRIKEAFRAGASIETATLDANDSALEVSQIVYRPFSRETETERLGKFADLEIAFLLSDEVPGRIAAMTAISSGGAASGGYEERIEFLSSEEVPQ